MIVIDNHGHMRYFEVQLLVWHQRLAGTGQYANCQLGLAIAVKKVISESIVGHLPREPESPISLFFMVE